MTTPSGSVIPRMTLAEVTADVMMTPNPVSVREKATVADTTDLLMRRKIGAAPVIDDAGRPVGVISRADILVHDREAVHYLAPHRRDKNPSRHDEDHTWIRDIMTPVVFCVSPRAKASEVVHKMVELKVHRLFVVDDSGTLVGVISVLDLLRQLRL